LEEHIASIITTLMMEGVCSSKTSVLTRATWHHIPEDGILLSIIIIIIIIIIIVIFVFVFVVVF
jgi:heme/copper-type cytochrome/quinol oxidase subunit 2